MKDNNGCYNNLCAQVDSLFKNSRHDVSIKTRYKYNDIEHKFCQFLSDNYKLQKLENVKSKHVIAYTEKLKSEGKSVSTIKSSLAAVRYFHELSGSKNILIDNKQLNIGERKYAQIDKTWSRSEVAESLLCAAEMGRFDIYHAINLSANMGFRLEEVVKVTPKHLQDALENGSCWTRGKNGQERYIQIRNEHQVQAIKEALAYADKHNISPNSKLLCDNMKGSVQKEKRSIQNFITANQYKFIDNRRMLVGDNQLFANDTKKIVQTRIHFHGLRYYYCNNLYKDIYSETKDKAYSERYCSEQLGHHRRSILATYKQ